MTLTCAGAQTCTCSQAAAPAQKALHRNAPGLARVLGADSPVFVAALRDTPPGSEALLLQMLYALTGALLLGAAELHGCRLAFTDLLLFDCPVCSEPIHSLQTLQARQAQLRFACMRLLPLC